MEATLILGRMPEGSQPEHFRAAGPWCFAGREELFPGWENSFQFAPEPLRDVNILAQTAREACAIFADNLPALAARLCPYSAALPDAYWETLLAPWGVDVARQIADRWQRVKAMTGTWGDLPLRVPLLPENCAFRFTGEHDFTLYGSLGISFNHWLFSRLLEACWPTAWRRKYLPPVNSVYGNSAPPALKERVKHWARRILLRLPFPRLKGVSLWQSLRFSLALAHTSRGQDRSLPLAATFGAAATGADAHLPLDPLPIFLAALPEAFTRLEHPRALRKSRTAPRLRVASVLAYEDTIYRQKLAVWRGRGNRLMYVQHGSGYGQARVACLSAVVEYSQHAFVTWGWNDPAGCRGNFISLPYPQVARIAGRWKGTGGKSLLFVGTEMPLFAYRLDSWPTPLQLLRYRNDKARFFTALKKDLHPRALYRPYFPVPGTFKDADWLLPQFPRVRLCTGPLTRQMLRCRVFVIDHPGTTMLESLAADAPTVLYWSRDAWPQTSEHEELLDVLAEAGILHAGPEEAAAKVNSVFDDAPDWWKGETVQAARRQYCARYAMTVAGSENDCWVNTLTKL